MNNSPQRAAKGFTRAFWVSNTVELFERMAYYAVFIVLTIYLSSILGFNDFEASMISAQVRKSVDSPPGILTEDHHHTVHEESQVCYSSHLRPKSLHL